VSAIDEGAAAAAVGGELALATHSRHTSLGMTNVRSQRWCRHSETEDVRQGLGRSGRSHHAKYAYTEG